MTQGDLAGHAGTIGVAVQIKRWLLVALGLGFLGLTVDVFLEHYFTIHSMREPQWIPVVFGPLAGAIALVTAWRFEAVSLWLFSLASWLSLGVGGLGLFFHGRAVARNFEHFAELLDPQALFAILPHATPLGAPMAFVGIGILGLLVHTCAVKLEHMVRPRTRTASVVFALAFLLLVLAPLSPLLIHVLF